MLIELYDLGELWDTFKRETLKAAGESSPRSKSEVTLRATLKNIEESRAATLTGDWHRCKAFSRRT